MDFALYVAPFIMRAIVETPLSKDDAFRQATSIYIDDVFINENIASATWMDKYKDTMVSSGKR